MLMPTDAEIWCTVDSHIYISMFCTTSYLNQETLPESVWDSGLKFTLESLPNLG